MIIRLLLLLIIIALGVHLLSSCAVMSVNRVVPIVGPIDHTIPEEPAP